jgi:hypothetical protein
MTVVSTDLDGLKRQVCVSGYRAIHVAASLQDVLRSAKLRGRELTSTQPIPLSPQIGAHVELVLRAVKPLQRVDRITAVAEGVAGMSREEAAYWHAQVGRRNGLRALRLLFVEGSRR